MPPANAGPHSTLPEGQAPERGPSDPQQNQPRGGGRAQHANGVPAWTAGFTAVTVLNGFRHSRLLACLARGQPAGLFAFVVLLVSHFATIIVSDYFTVPDIDSDGAGEYLLQP